MKNSLASRFAVAAAALALALAPLTGGAAEDPRVSAVLTASGAALGVAALPRLRTLHLRGSGQLAGIPAKVESWQDVRDGSFTQSADAGPLSGANGFDGSHVWTRDAGGVVYDDGSVGGRASALDAAYLNRYLLWQPGRGGAAVTYAGARTDGNARYDVLGVTPPGSLPFELWIDATTHLPARTVIRDRDDHHRHRMSDYRAVRGLRVAFAQSVEDEQFSATFAAAKAEADSPAADAMLRRPAGDIHDATIAGGTSTSIPFELVDNHVALAVTIDGKGPFHFLFDTGGAERALTPTWPSSWASLRAAASTGAGVGATTEAFQFATVDALGVGAATLRQELRAGAPVRAGFGAGERYADRRADRVRGAGPLRHHLQLRDEAGRAGGPRAHGAGARHDHPVHLRQHAGR